MTLTVPPINMTHSLQRPVFGVGEDDGGPSGAGLTKWTYAYDPSAYVATASGVDAAITEFTFAPHGAVSEPATRIRVTISTSSICVGVLTAGKFLTGQSATWGQGDWNGAPGGSLGAPPTGDGRLDQLDIVAALGPGLLPDR